MKAIRLLVVDYGMGNLRSISKAFERLGARVRVSSSRRALARADGVVLPGVGAFGEAMVRLKRLKLVEPLREWIREDRPFLGVCLGYQLLFDGSVEFGRHKGRGCFSGRVKPFPKGLQVPHMGWNSLESAKRGWLLKGLTRRPYVYFVHSFFPAPKDRTIVAARTDYGVKFASAIERSRVAGVQFHPEKSQQVGLKIVRNFIEVVRRCQR